jgi:glycosyltransferase involved in cell wall biosynthesis
MRVLWLASTFFPKVGGLQLFIEKTIASLTRYCEVGLVTRACHWFPGDEPIRHFPIVQPSSWSDPDAWKEVKESLDETIAAFSPDIVHFGSAQVATCRTFIPAEIPCVATVHGNDLTCLRQTGYGGEDPTAFVVQSLDECDAVLAVSSHTANLIRQWGVRAPIDVLTPGCDLDFYRPWPELANRARTTWQIPESIPVILTVGRLARRKGHFNTLEAIRRLSFPVHWVIVGRGIIEAELADEIRQQGLVNRVSMVGCISDDDLLALYNTASVFVFIPEQLGVNGFVDSEGFGLVLHEAGACGKPVITSNEAGCLDAVIDGGTGILVQPGDPQELADAIETILTRPELADQLGRGALELVRGSGGWHRLAKQTYDKYEEILCRETVNAPPLANLLDLRLQTSGNFSILRS